MNIEDVLNQLDKLTAQLAQGKIHQHEFEQQRLCVIVDFKIAVQSQQ